MYISPFLGLLNFILNHSKMFRLLYNHKFFLKKFIPGYKEIKKINSKLDELLFASIFRDSIRGQPEFESLSINIGRWAGGYPFFYVLGRILRIYKPNSILELGLGESTKFINNFNKVNNPSCKHLIIEHDENFIKNFLLKYDLNFGAEIINLPLDKKFTNKFPTYYYKNFENLNTDLFEFYLIDGPFGSDRFSRTDILSIVKKFDRNRQFLILFDDTNRLGEIDTLNAIIRELNFIGLKFYIANYSGIKSSTIIASEKYKLSATF